ncbi:Transmembrane protein [Fasciola hepatica]|nr:Transmembrane protein [Fasciola hepatica]
MVLSFTSISACFGAYKFMSYMATPTFGMNDRGVEQIQDAGLDLNISSGGIAEHAKDAIIMCCAILILSVVHRYFWLLLLLIPCRIFHILWVNILAPWIFDPNQEPQVNEKKQQKLERKMRRIGHLTQRR